MPGRVRIISRFLRSGNRSQRDGLNLPLCHLKERMSKMLKAIKGTLKITAEIGKGLVSIVALRGQDDMADEFIDVALSQPELESLQLDYYDDSIGAYTPDPGDKG